jgi:hypothetical protein
VTDVVGLTQAVAMASPGDTILLAPGTYLLSATLFMSTPNVTLRSETDDPASVILDGGDVVAPVRMQSTGVALVSLTVARSVDDGARIEPTASGTVTDISIYDVTFLDNRNTGTRVIPYASQAAGPFADTGTIACSRFVHSTAGTCPDNGIFGVQMVGTRGWTVRDSYFAGRCSPMIARAVSVDGGSRDTTIIDNVFSNNLNNIMLGNFTLRTYPDPLPATCSGTPAFWGGLACNNRIAGLGVPSRAGAFDFDEGIALWRACDVWVMHNTITSPGATETFSEIEYRFAGSYVHLVNNLVGMAPVQRDGGGLDPASVTTVYPSTAEFVDAIGGDLRLASTTTIAPGASIASIGSCATDAAGRARSTTSPMPGAYER